MHTTKRGGGYSFISCFCEKWSSNFVSIRAKCIARGCTNVTIIITMTSLLQMKGGKNAFEIPSDRILESRNGEIA